MSSEPPSPLGPLGYFISGAVEQDFTLRRLEGEGAGKGANARLVERNRAARLDSIDHATSLHVDHSLVFPPLSLIHI